MHQDVMLTTIGFAGLGAVLFFMLGYFIRKRYATKKLKNAEERAKKTLENAAVEADSQGLQGVDKRERLLRVVYVGNEIPHAVKQQAMDSAVSGLGKAQDRLQGFAPFRDAHTFFASNSFACH